MKANLILFGTLIFTLTIANAQPILTNVVHNFKIGDASRYYNANQNGVKEGPIGAN